MSMLSLKSIYVMWLREQKIFFRSRSRVIGTLFTPILFLIFIGFGFSSASFQSFPEGLDYFQFLVPGIIGMGLLFRSIFFGVSVLWDRQFGFLKEIMVAPVSRLSIMLGRTAGGATTVLAQGVLILVITLLLGFQLNSIISLIPAAAFMLMISIIFISLGLVIASQMKDMEGFGLIMNFVTFPLFFLSGALYPLDAVPEFLRYFSYIDPLTYGVDGLRAALTGYSMFSMYFDAAVCLGFSILMLFMGAYFFGKSKAV